MVASVGPQMVPTGAAPHLRGTAPARRPPVPQPRPAESSPAEIGIPPPPWEQGPHRSLWPLVAAIVVILVAGAGITGYQLWAAHRAPSQTQHREPTYGPQVTLPFTGLNTQGVAVDSAGNLYVTEIYPNKQVLELAAGSSTPTVLPFTGFKPVDATAVDVNGPEGVAVDTAGNLYVTDTGNNRVRKLPAGSDTQTVLPFTGLNDPPGVAVDTAGTLYVADAGNNRVLKLAAGSSTPTVLPFTGLNGPDGVAVDSAGTLYVGDGGNKRVVKLAVGSGTQAVLPFPTAIPNGVAVDTAGNLYVPLWNSDTVWKLAAGSTAPTKLPFTGDPAGGVPDPTSVAVDTASNIYVTDRGNFRVVKLPAG
jgi:serine/threonine-protein kinase